MEDVCQGLIPIELPLHQDLDVFGSGDLPPEMFVHRNIVAHVFVRGQCQPIDANVSGQCFRVQKKRLSNALAIVLRINSDIHDVERILMPGGVQYSNELTIQLEDMHLTGVNFVDHAIRDVGKFGKALCPRGIGTSDDMSDLAGILRCRLADYSCHGPIFQDRLVERKRSSCLSAAGRLAKAYLGVPNMG